MVSVYLQLSDRRSTRSFNLPPTGTASVFVLVLDALPPGGYVVAYPALTSDATASLTDGAPTIKVQRSPSGGGAVLTFTGSHPAKSDGAVLSPNVPYSFGADESFSFHGIVGATAAESALRQRDAHGDARGVVVMATGFVLDELTLSYLYDKGARVLYDLKDIGEVTHLVVGTTGSPPSCVGARRSAKLLAAASLQSVQIVNYSWLLSSIRVGCGFQSANREVYAPRDPALEASHGFTFARLTSPATCSPLSGIAVFVSVRGDVTERVAELQAVVQFAGGSIIERPGGCDGAAAARLSVVVALFDKGSKPAWCSDSHKVIDGEGILRAICSKTALDVGAWSL
jgi:hypothetical protein